MEFTVSKSDLVRELSLSQGVVEKKTTIPILSNVLLEASADRITLTATDLELGIRCSCPARVKKKAPERSRPKAAGLCAAVAGRRREHEVPREPLGEYHLWALEDADRGNVPGEFSGAAADAGADCTDPGEDAGLHDWADIVRDFDGGVALTLNGALLLMKPDSLTMVATDGHRLAFVQAPPESSGSVDQQFRALVPRRPWGSC